MDGDGVNEMMNKIEALKIGDILRYTYTDTETGSEWQDGDGNAVGGMLAIFCDYTLGDVKSEDKLQEIVNKMTLRDVLGNSVDSNAIFKKLGDKKIGELTEAINDLYIGDILDYGKVENKTSDGYRIYVDNDGNEYYNTTVLDENGTFTGAWSSVDAANAATAAGIAFDSNVGRYKYADGKYLAESNDWNEKDGNAVTGVRSILANFKVGELDDPDFDARINSLVGTLVLSNVIEIDTSSPKILQLLANSKLNKLSEDINKLYIGEILDYSKITKTNAGGYSIYADVDGNEYYEFVSIVINSPSLRFSTEAVTRALKSESSSSPILKSASIAVTPVTSLLSLSYQVLISARNLPFASLYLPVSLSRVIDAAELSFALNQLSLSSR